MQKFIKPDNNEIFGHFENPVGIINYRDYPLRSPFREILPIEERKRQFVHFHFIGFTSTRFIAGCSLTYNNDSATAFFYLFDRSKGELVKKGVRATTENEFSISLDPDNGITKIAKNDLSVAFEFGHENLTKSLKLQYGSDIRLDINFAERQNEFETLRLCTPTGPSGWTYCQKVAGIKAEGEISINGETFDLDALESTAHHDFTAGFLRRDTFWNWACVTGIDEMGQYVGLNISNGVNETGWTENVLWLDGIQHRIGQFHFIYDPDNLDAAWTIQSDHGSKLTFTCENKYAAFNKKIETGFDFHQLFGRFEGKILTLEGREVEIKNLPGFCERQFAIWY